MPSSHAPQPGAWLSQSRLKARINPNSLNYLVWGLGQVPAAARVTRGDISHRPFTQHKHKWAGAVAPAAEAVVTKGTPLPPNYASS